MQEVENPKCTTTLHKIDNTYVMNQDDIDEFVVFGTETPKAVMEAVASGIPVNGRYHYNNRSALDVATFNKRGDVIVALLAFGADANATNKVDGETSMYYCDSADILQLLINGGGSVNDINNDGESAF